MLLRDNMLFGMVSGTIAKAFVTAKDALVHRLIILLASSCRNIFESQSLESSVELLRASALLSATTWRWRLHPIYVGLHLQW
jgi:hypothetical protein